MNVEVFGEKRYLFTPKRLFSQSGIPEGFNLTKYWLCITNEENWKVIKRGGMGSSKETREHNKKG